MKPIKAVEATRLSLCAIDLLKTHQIQSWATAGGVIPAQLFLIEKKENSN